MASQMARIAAVASDIHISDQMNGVFLSGVRGTSLCDGQYKLPMIALDNEMPHFVVLQIGTNYLACGAPPNEVDFDVVIDSYNTILQGMCACKQFVVYRSHSGFW